MKLSRSSRSKADVFTGTMADVSFLLIIFFMITAAFSVSKGIDFAFDEPPKNDEAVEPWEAVDVHVQDNGTIEVDGRTMAFDELLFYVRAKLEKSPKKPVILRAERDTTYGAVIRVLDELRQSNERLGFDIPNLAIPTFREQVDYSFSFKI